MSSLDDEAAGFAGRLDRLLQGTVSSDVRFGVVSVGDDRRKIGPEPFELELNKGASGFSLIPLVRKCDDPEQPAVVGFKVEFDVTMDGDGHHLMVARSAFGLWVRPDKGRRMRPVFRVEYDRDARAKPPAHVHLHAESVELGWVYGSARKPLPRMEEIHFPVGGRRFRPTVEELLLFLDREDLFTDWANDQWRTHIEASQQDWEQRQARATVRRFPEEAASQLASMGYTVAKSDEPVVVESAD